MKKYLLGLILTTLFTPNTFAAEKDANANTAFSGVYAGLHLGYLNAKDKGNETLYSPGNPPDPTWAYQSLKPRGILYSLSAGYNYKINQRFLVGLEGELGGANADDRTLQNYPIDDGCSNKCYPVSSKVKFSYSIRPRIGVLLNQEKTLLYVTGGLEGARIKRSFSWDTTDPIASISNNNEDNSRISKSDWQTGWSAGAGIEHLIADQVTARLEFRHTDLGSKNIDTTSVYASNADIASGERHIDHMNYKDNSLRLGVVYHY